MASIIFQRQLLTHSHLMFRHKTSVDSDTSVVPFFQVHVCEICHKVYQYKQSLNDHMRGRHGIGKPIACVCGAKFSWRSLLIDHRKTCPIACAEKLESQNPDLQSKETMENG